MTTSCFSCLVFLFRSCLVLVFIYGRTADWSRLLLYELLSGFGFWSGHTFSSMIGWDFWKLGPLHLGFRNRVEHCYFWVLVIGCQLEEKSLNEKK